ncbi:protein BTG2-like [Aquarana catesbeiana]|uniref:protein BTG2-like n=1 Tax=Aquarana catesbeiana TaxID=8400 RepID=UPI003CC9D0C9
MMLLPGIPLVMMNEILAGVDLIKILASTFEQLSQDILDEFGDKLAIILCHRYTGHWNLSKPKKGQAYRCIRSNKDVKDPSILEACAQCGLEYTDLCLPDEMTLWINPNDVSVLVVVDNHTYTMKIYGPGALSASEIDFMMEQESTILDDISIAISSLSISPSYSDSGNGSSTQDITPPTSCTPPEEDICQAPSVEPGTLDSESLPEEQENITDK